VFLGMRPRKKKGTQASRYTICHFIRGGERRRGTRALKKKRPIFPARVRGRERQSRALQVSRRRTAKNDYVLLPRPLRRGKKRRCRVHPSRIPWVWGGKWGGGSSPRRSPGKKKMKCFWNFGERFVGGQGHFPERKKRKETAPRASRVLRKRKKKQISGPRFIYRGKKRSTISSARGEKKAPKASSDLLITRLQERGGHEL